MESTVMEVSRHDKRGPEALNEYLRRLLREQIHYSDIINLENSTQKGLQ